MPQRTCTKMAKQSCGAAGGGPTIRYSSCPLVRLSLWRPVFRGHPLCFKPLPFAHGGRFLPAAVLNASRCWHEWHTRVAMFVHAVVFGALLCLLGSGTHTWCAPLQHSVSMSAGFESIFRLFRAGYFLVRLLLCTASSSSVVVCLGGCSATCSLSYTSAAPHIAHTQLAHSTLHFHTAHSTPIEPYTHIHRW